MDKAEIQEALVTLYLRLNGYFTSGFIVHSPVVGENLTEVDVLAVRFPKNAEPERGVEIAPELEADGQKTDIVIGEVKSRGQQLQFNPALHDSTQALSRVLRWIGLFEEREIWDLATVLSEQLSPSHANAATPPTIQGPRETRLRGLLFSPERDARRYNQPWFLAGPPIFDHIWRCLRPQAARPECATAYDFGLWGRELEPIIRYFKDQTTKGPGNFEELCARLRG